MAFYTNSQGDLVEISQEHIDTSIKIKLELQKASPSGKCSWKQHKKLMEVEGFSDSDTCETYRVLIRDYQRKKGLLPTVDKYANFVSDNKLKSIENMIGELYLAKRECSQERRELNKTKREIADDLTVINSITEAVKQLDFNFRDEENPNKYPESDNQYVGIVTPSDWHIGLVIDGEGVECAKQRIVRYAYRVIDTCVKFDVNTVYVCNLGDIVNNVYMHKNTQAYNSELTLAEQIIRATELMVDFLDILATKLNVVYVGTVSGNHGRMSVKGETLFNDNAEVIVHNMIKTVIEERRKAGYVNIISEGFCYNGEYVINYINDSLCLFVHGDKEKTNGKDVIKKYSSIFDEPVDYVFKGHTHNFKVESENYDRKIVTSGCLMGSDDYAKSLGYYSLPTQNMVILGNDVFIPIEFRL